MHIFISRGIDAYSLRHSYAVNEHWMYLDFNPLMPTVAISAHVAIKHPVPDQVKPSFVIFDIWALCCSALSVRVPECQKLQL